ncbi:MAG: DNA primase [Kiritimatiellae bacterium]|nr:DNA primase [Kiritimatiellia bacterium]
MQVGANTLEEIKSRIDLCDLLSSHGVDVKRMRGGYWACCPFHHEKTPSFKIDPDKGFYFCFGCQRHGDAITFLMENDGLSFTEAVANLAEKCGVRLDLGADDPQAGLRKRLFAVMAAAARFYRLSLKNLPEAETARRYLASRAIPEEAAEAFSIGYAPEGVRRILDWAKKNGFTEDELDAAGIVKKASSPGDRPYHRFSGRLMFTIRDRQGRAVAFSGRQLVENKNSGKYVNSPETAIFKKSSVLFGFDRAAGSITRAANREAIVCEGQIDTIRLHISGFPVAVASQGTAFTETHAKMLARVADGAYLVFDDDAAGHKATVKTAALLLAEGMSVRAVSLPGGHDPDSFLREKGADAFRDCLASAESIVSFQTRTDALAEREPESVEAVSRMARHVISTIGACPNAVMKAKMLEEAAERLKIPVAALAEELGKSESAGSARRRDAAPQARPHGDAPASAAGAKPAAAAADAGSAARPGALEMSFMKYLFSAPDAQSLAAGVKEYFPDGVFANAFTVSFVKAWLAEALGDRGAFATLQCSLTPVTAPWLDEVVAGSGDYAPSHDNDTEALRDFARRMWKAKADALRKSIPASGGNAADLMNLAMTSKSLASAGWEETKEMISKLRNCHMKGEQ